MAEASAEGGRVGEGLFYINASYSFQGEANPQGLNYNCQLCKYSFGAVVALGSGCFFGLGKNKRVKKGFFVCEGRSFRKLRMTQKAFFYWLVAGENNGYEGGEKPAEGWGALDGWAQKRLRSKPLLINFGFNLDYK
ncbi:hypothetical protein JJC03_04595 [Flavobacterium oreochromis]|uniref:hypothetical protein n=1 Tax=Flavobacterium oreochromis TaxID=2906078 RepID=UPI001CE5A204|nr:hypothetical protein [Flavobacterium oreochromis]QYS87213.1 hypothetical protein JJC03_04530 [Flavobacterium oreochromis]QYS87222.1 hypothetical protein JJC03_04595 [Flavobacterium oreochromis]